MALRDNLLIKKLLSLQLPVEHYVVFGSGPLLAHGIKDDVRDLDILARGPAWSIAITRGTPSVPPSGNGLVVELFDGNIEIFSRWVTDDWKADELIDGAEIIDGIPFVPLDVVLLWKRTTARKKDRQDIESLEHYLA